MDDAGAAAFAVGELVGLLGNDWRSRLRFISRTRWRQAPWVGGSYSHARVGSADQRQVLAAPVGDRLFFAGEACSTSDFSTCHGALGSGWAAADQVLGLLKTTR